MNNEKINNLNKYSPYDCTSAINYILQSFSPLLCYYKYFNNNNSDETRSINYNDIECISGIINKLKEDDILKYKLLKRFTKHIINVIDNKKNNINSDELFSEIGRYIISMKDESSIFKFSLGPFEIDYYKLFPVICNSLIQHYNVIYTPDNNDEEIEGLIKQDMEDDDIGNCSIWKSIFFYYLEPKKRPLLTSNFIIYNRSK